MPVRRLVFERQTEEEPLIIFLFGVEERNETNKLFFRGNEI